MKLVKDKMYWIKSEQVLGSFISGCEFDVDGGLGLYDIEQDVVDVAELEADNAELRTEVVFAWDTIRFIKDLNSLNTESRNEATLFLTKHEELVRRMRLEQRNEQGEHDGY